MHIKIIYTSITGNTELVCQQVTEYLEKHDHQVSLERCQLTDITTLKDCDCLIFASPTYAHGELQVYFQQFLNKISDQYFTNQPCAVIGLGDPKYDDDYTVESARILSDFFEARGAHQILSPLKVERCPLPQLETKVKEWTNQLISKLPNT